MEYLSYRSNTCEDLGSDRQDRPLDDKGEDRCDVHRTEVSHRVSHRNSARSWQHCRALHERNRRNNRFAELTQNRVHRGHSDRADDNDEYHKVEVLNTGECRYSRVVVNAACYNEW